MKTLIIGAGGQVGGALNSVLKARSVDSVGTCHAQAAPGLIPLDVTDDAAVRAIVSRERPNVVFLTAALTAVDYAEDHQDEAYRINVEGASSVARACGDVGAKLV